MSQLLLFVRSMGVRRGLRAWWRMVGLRADLRSKQHFQRQVPTIHHGERPKYPGWRR